MGKSEKKVIFAKLSGRSAVRLAHLLWEQGVEGSNPFTPTKKATYKITVRGRKKHPANRETTSPGGGMVDALVSGASAARRAGSSPVLGTHKSRK